MNDKEIISAIAGGNEQMLGFAVKRYSKLLWKTAAPILVNAASAEDVEECVADVFIYLWEHPEKYDAQKGKLSSWLAMIARSKAIDRYRREVKKREISIEEMTAEGLKTAENYQHGENGKNEILISCLRRLGETEKELIIRRYYYEQKPKDIAEALCMPKKQVENKLYCARQKLKKMTELQTKATNLPDSAKAAESVNSTESAKQENCRNGSGD